MASPASPASPAAPERRDGAPPRPAAKGLALLPSTAQLEANYRIAAAAAAGTLHQEVVDAQAWDVLTGMLVLRWCGAFFVRTFFQPDEYFQALEPAWQLAHGPASGAWLTWEWRHRLRASLHPVLFAGVYAALEAVLGLAHIVGPLRALVLVAAPGLVQAAFTALGDYYVWRLAGQLYGHSDGATWAALWLSVANPWQLYTGARTFSNGLEATLTIAALSYWPWQLLAGAVDAKPGVLFANGGIRRLRVSLLLAATAVVLRPTNILIWFALLTITVTRLTLDGPASSSSSSSSSFLGRAVLVRLLAEAVGCGSVVLALSAVSDRLYYGAWTFPAYTFLDINLTQDVAVFYGRSPWHYYLSQGLPLLTTTALPFALYALYAALVAAAPSSSSAETTETTEKKTTEKKTAAGAMEPTHLANARRALAFTVVATVAALSLVAHKEVRFLSPLLPVLLVLAAPHAASFFTTATAATTAGAADKSAAPPSKPPTTTTTTTLRHKKLLAVGLAANAALAAYLSLFHQPAPLGVLAFLRAEYERIHHDWLEMPADQLPSYDVYPDSFLSPPSELAAVTSDGDGDELFALFLVPCHTTPWRSHLVYPGLRARALTCEPPLATAPRSAERASYLDEADRFYADQGRFLATELWPLLLEESGRGGRRRGGELPRYIVGFEGVEDALARFFASDDAAMGGADLGVQVPLRRAWTGWNGLANEDGRRRGALVVWDTGVYSNASHPDTERAFDESDQPFVLW